MKSKFIESIPVLNGSGDSGTSSADVTQRMMYRIRVLPQNIESYRSIGDM